MSVETLNDLQESLGISTCRVKNLCLAWPGDITMVISLWRQRQVGGSLSSGLHSETVLLCSSGYPETQSRPEWP